MRYIDLTPAQAETAQETADNFMPIHTDSLRMDTSPPFALYFRPGADKPYVLYCERKTQFTREARRRGATRVARRFTGPSPSTNQ